MATGASVRIIGVGFAWLAVHSAASSGDAELSDMLAGLDIDIDPAALAFSAGSTYGSASVASDFERSDDDAGTCVQSLRALNGCSARVAAEAACSTARLLNNSASQSLLGCANLTLAKCSARCLDRFGSLGLPLNSTDFECTIREQLMKQYSGQLNLIVTFLDDPVSGLRKPQIIPSSVADVKGFPSFSYYGEYQRCIYGDDMQYCLLEGSIASGPLKASALMGLCRPSSCSEDEITDHLGLLSAVIDLDDSKLSCHRLGDDPPPIEWTKGRAAALGVFAVIAVLLIVGTMQDKATTWRRRRMAGAGDRAQAFAEVGPQPPGGCIAGFLSAWSTSRNLASFGSLRRSRSSELDMSMLDGLRVISTFWIILGHALLWPLLSIQYENVGMILPPQGRLSTTWFQIIPGGYFAVDTFFWLSGFLGARQLHTKVQKSPSLLSPAGFCLRLFPLSLLARWLRLTVVYAFVLMVTQTWYRELGSGSLLWNIGTGFSSSMRCVGSIDNDSCKDNWWKQLLYINNLYEESFGSMCMSWTWYLACDMQMFLLLPFLVLIRERAGKATSWCIITLLTVVSAVGCVLKIWIGALLSDPVLGSFGTVLGGSGNFQNEVYQVSWFRVQPYFIGVAAAWWLDSHSRSGCDSASLAVRAAPLLRAGQLSRGARDQETGGARESPLVSRDDGQDAASDYQQPPWTCRDAMLSLALQLVSIAAMCFVVFIPVTRYQCDTLRDCIVVEDAPWPTSVNALYGGLNHAVWGLGLSVLMVSSMIRAPLTEWIPFFFGADFWQGPAKLTYSAYLLHPLVLVFFYCRQDKSLHYLDSTFFTNFLAYAFITFGLSLLLWLFVEKPGANLSAMLLSAITGQTRNGDA